MFRVRIALNYRGLISHSAAMLMLRAKPPESWLPFVLENLPAVLVDHAHLERKAASSALNLEKYRLLSEKVEELNAIAIEELQHFQMVMDLLKARGIRFGPSPNSPWISGLMRHVRRGQREQVIDHLICAALVEGRSCEKFQILGDALEERDVELAAFYQGLVESEGNHYATYLIMAREIDEEETDQRLDFFLDRDAELVRILNPKPMLH